MGVSTEQTHSAGPTGPRTPEGKATVRKNAIKHGLRSSATLVVAGETEEALEAHRTCIIENLSPVGPVETILVDRIALLLWRLSRAAGAEANALRAAQPAIEASGAVQLLRELAESVERTANLGPQVADRLLSAIKKGASDPTEAARLRMLGSALGYGERYTADLARALRLIAETLGSEGSVTLPGLLLIARYEAHLSRELGRTLKQYWDLQAWRHATARGPDVPWKIVR